MIASCAPPDCSLKAASLVLPQGATDCHAHVFDSCFPVQENRSYTPAIANKVAYYAMLKTLGFERAVMVQPSVYGMDNSAILDCMQDTQSGLSFRGVAVIPVDSAEQHIQALHDVGIRGVRVNLLFKGGISKQDIQTLAKRIAAYAWHIQFLIDISDFADFDALIRSLPVDVVIDHMGHMPAVLGVEHPSFQKLLRLLDEGTTWVKLSGAYRMTSEKTPPYQDVMPFAQKLVQCNPDRLVYGTDWPHPSIQVPMPNDADLLDQVEHWCPDSTTQQKIFSTNPEKLYQF